jgi:hypothetical protein
MASDSGRGMTWPWFGLAALVLGIIGTWAVIFLLSESELESGGETMREALDTDTNQAIYRVSSGLLFLAAGSLVTFAVAFRRMLGHRLINDSIAPRVLELALVVSAAGLVVGAIARAMVFDTGLDSYNGEALSAMVALGVDVPLASWGAVGLAAAAAAVLALRERVLPAWFGWLSVLVVVVDVFLGLSGTPFPMNFAGFIWLLAATVVAFMVRSNEPVTPAPTISPPSATALD